MSEPTDFLSRLAAGTACPEDIDDDIDAWHDGPGTQELHAFLGMTETEYATWLRHPEILVEICRAREPTKRTPHQQRQLKRAVWTKTTTVLHTTRRYRIGQGTAAARLVTRS